MSGFENDVLVASNVNFDESGPKPHLGIITTAGQLPIGTGASLPTAQILAGSIISPLGTLSIGYSSPNITLDLTGGLNTPGIFGDGSDGSVTFDGSSVVLGLTPSTSIYTLTRDIYLKSSTVNTGVSIITNGFKIYCLGTFTNNGTMQWNGNAGTSAGVAGAALSSTNGTINAVSPSTAGGAGNTGGGSNGTNQTLVTGGAGGAGGAGGSGGGAGGTVTSPPANAGTLRAAPQSVLGIYIGGASGGAFSINRGGTGGGGGGGDGAVHGGGGGGGAGIVLLNILSFAGTGNIQAIGGAGGSPGAGTNTGGGGGGGGGVVIINSSSVASGSIAGQTINVSGGTAGTGFGSGANGSNGGAGNAFLVPA